MLRLATFRVAPGNSDTYPVRLAEAGFYYSRTRLAAVCEGCGKFQDLTSFTSDHTSQIYHEIGCSFVQLDANAETLAAGRSNTPEAAVCQKSFGSLNDDASFTRHRGYTSHPSNPAYITFTKRLESFSHWSASHIHTLDVLARSGFYYASYSDCVRCFQCGLGLKSWKPGDDVVDQHERFRPECPFLRLQLRNDPSEEYRFHNVSGNVDDLKNVRDQNNVSNNEAASKHTTRGNKGSTELTVNKKKKNLLQSENDILKNHLKCKVCKTAPIKDLFLPCGDLYACGDCSKSLTHCPACNKQILATVTTFLHNNTLL